MQRNGNAQGHAAFDAALRQRLGAAGLRTTQYAILEELQRQADAAPIAALQFVEVAACSARLPPSLGRTQRPGPGSPSP
jgi:hypothetical protein